MKKCIVVLTLLLLASAGQNAFGALFYEVETNGSGGFVNGGWTGNGTVTGPAGFNQATGSTMISGFSGSGQLDMGRMATFIQQAGVGGVGNLNFNTGVTASMDITLNGGAADLVVNTFTHRNTNRYPNGFNVTNLSGVDSLVVEFNWSEPLAAATNGDIPPSVFNAPFLGSIRGLVGGSFDVTSTYLGLTHTTDAMTLTPGLPANAEGVDMLNSESTWGTDGASSSWIIDDNFFGSAWQGINGFDLTGGNYTTGTQADPTLFDVEMVYATGIRYEVSNTDESPMSGSSFLFSTNGNQWQQTVDLPVVPLTPFICPEPATLIIAALGLLGVGWRVCRRKRRNACCARVS